MEFGTIMIRTNQGPITPFGCPNLLLMTKAQYRAYWNTLNGDTEDTSPILSSDNIPLRWNIGDVRYLHFNFSSNPMQHDPKNPAIMGTMHIVKINRNKYDAISGVLEGSMDWALLWYNHLKNPEGYWPVGIFGKAWINRMITQLARHGISTVDEDGSVLRDPTKIIDRAEQHGIPFSLSTFMQRDIPPISGTLEEIMTNHYNWMKEQADIINDLANSSGLLSLVIEASKEFEKAIVEQSR